MPHHIGELETTIRVEMFFDAMVEAKDVQIGDWYQFGERWFRVAHIEDSIDHSQSWPDGIKSTVIKSDDGRHWDKRDPNEGVVVRRQVERA